MFTGVFEGIKDKEIKTNNPSYNIPLRTKIMTIATIFTCYILGVSGLVTWILI